MKTNFLKISFIILCFSMGLMSCSKEDNPPDTHPSTRSVATLAPEKVTTSTAYISGLIRDPEAGAIVSSGILLSESSESLIPDPLLISECGAKKYPGVIEGDGKFFVSLSDLKSDTRYNYVAFATTVSGTFYGEVKLLVTSYGTVNDIDGNQYQTVRIGDQIWMRENLKSSHYADQTSIAGHYDLETDEVFGKHYSWDAANRSTSGAKSGTLQGACPTGWHIPGDGEWQKLLSYVGVPSNQFNSYNLIGDKQAIELKVADTDFWADKMIDNRTGFTALPACLVRKCNQEICCLTAFWSSTPGIFYGFQNESEKIVRGNHPNCTCGFSVRCVKD